MSGHTYGTQVKVGTPIGRVGTPYVAHTQPPTNPWASTIGPADVKVGDVVEVEADDGSWLVRGEVVGIYPQHADEYRIFLLNLDGHEVPIAAKHATVRLVRRAEPEPDPAQVDRLAETLIDTGCGDEDPFGLARELVRRGVTVGGAT